MPCPIRFGPPPSTMILRRSVGCASSSSSYVEYMYAVRVANSAAQVSTRLNTGRMPSAWRLARTCASVALNSLARRRSEKPLRLSSNMRAASMSASARSSSSISSFTMSSICARNHGSILVSEWISSSVNPFSKASPT